MRGRAASSGFGMAGLVVGERFASDDAEVAETRSADRNSIRQALSNEHPELVIAAMWERPTGLLEHDFHIGFGAIGELYHARLSRAIGAA